MKLYRLICLPLALLVLTVASPLAGESRDAVRREKYKKLHEEQYRERNKRMAYYGVVRDFHGNPVPDAKVLLEITFVPYEPFYTPGDEFRRIQLNTDNRGVFVIDDLDGHTVKIRDIEKEGYKYLMRYNPNWMVSLEYDKNKLDYANLKVKPVPYRMRKLNPPDFVFTTGMSFGLKPGETELLDLYQQKWVEPADLVAFRMTDKLWHADLKASLEKDGENFMVVIETPDPDSGFVTQEVSFIEEMAEAPVDGYVPRLVLPVQRGGGGSLFAYVKCAGGLFYSKIVIKYYNVEGRDSVYLDSAYQTNATGGRGLEYADDLYQEYLDEISDRSRVKLQRDVLQRGEQVVLPRPRSKP